MHNTTNQNTNYIVGSSMNPARSLGPSLIMNQTGTNTVKYQIRNISIPVQLCGDEHSRFFHAQSKKSKLMRQTSKVQKKQEIARQENSATSLYKYLPLKL